MRVDFYEQSKHLSQNSIYLRDVPHFVIIARADPSGQTPWQTTKNRTERAEAPEGIFLAGTLSFGRYARVINTLIRFVCVNAIT